MDNTILYAMMISAAVLMAVLPFGMFLGVGTLVGIPSSDWRIWVSYILLALMLSYGFSMGAFVLIQRSNCGEIKNMKQIALNSLFSMLFQVGMFVILGLLSWFRNVIRNILPPELDGNMKDAIMYSYYSFWAMMFGVALGGTMSGSCATS